MGEKKSNVFLKIDYLNFKDFAILSVFINLGSKFECVGSMGFQRSHSISYYFSLNTWRFALLLLH